MGFDDQSIMKKIVTPEQLGAVREQHARIAMCSGCYDILQSGHAVFFQQCKAIAPILVVSVGCDATLAALKGPNRPINPEHNRLYLLASLAAVDYVVLGDSDLLPGKIDFHSAARALRPDVFVLNEDDSAVAEKRKFLEALGVELAFVSRTTPDFLTPTSTTDIARKLAR
jgi:cytidyltransferase-like protein